MPCSSVSGIPAASDYRAENYDYYYSEDERQQVPTKM
jgi:hypothetical protein